MLIKFNFFATATSKIIFLNVIVFFAIWIASFFISQDSLIQVFALQPSNLFHGQMLWTLITSMFLHFSFWHLFVNMFSLYFLGSFVEKLIGKRRFYYFYLISGILAGVFWSSLSMISGSNEILIRVFGDSLVYGVGASGAIFGLIGLLAVLAPKNKVYLIAGPIIAILLQYFLSNIIKSQSMLNLLNILIFIYFLIALFSMFSFNIKLMRIALPLQLSMWMLPIIAIVPLIIISLFMELPIGNMAHLGGLLVGLLYGFYLRKKFPKKTELISKMFSR